MSGQIKDRTILFGNVGQRTKKKRQGENNPVYGITYIILSNNAF